MKILKRVTLTNFQAHKHKVFEFSKGLNAIYGDNNRGKSSLERAIYWICTNKPLGEWMRPQKGNKKLDTRAKMEFYDGFTAERIRGEHNSYIIEGQEFTELGSEVPQVLTEYLGDLRLMLGRNAFYPNFLLPDDTMFMIRESSIVKGSLLNCFTGFSLIEEMKRMVQKDIRDNKGVIKGKKSSLKVVSEDLKQYDELDEWSADNKRVQELAIRLGNAKERFAKVSEYFKLIHKHNKLIGQEDDLKRNLVTVTENCKVVELQKAAYKLMVDRIKEYKGHEKRYKGLKGMRDCTEEIDKLKARAERVLGFRTSYQRIRALCDERERLEKSMVPYREQLLSIQLEKSELPKVCPECGSPV